MCIIKEDVIDLGKTSITQMIICYDNIDAEAIILLCLVLC